jgi:alpha-beta hydrolase superfamily lysophospholipase
MTVVREHSLKAADGIDLSLRDWLVEGGRGGVVILHGLGEHSGRYLHVAQFFTAQGWSVRAFDLRGHGRSGGARGDSPDADASALLDDIQRVIDDFTALTGSAPLLFGHSMGGLFAARYATAAASELSPALSPICGLMLSSPALSVPLSGAQNILLKILRTLAPGMGIPNGVKSEFISHDAAVVQAYVSDPVVHAKISARLLGSMLAAIAYCQSHAANLKIPVLMVVAGDDRLVDASGSKRFFAQLDPHMASMHWYDRLYHEVLNEIEQQDVFDDMASWLKTLKSG